MGDNGKSKNEPISWPSLVPEFYYDLISRLPPGIIFIIGIAYTLNNKIFSDLMPKEAAKVDQLIEPPYLFIFILLLVAGYISGLVFLTPFGDCLGKVFYKCQYKKILKNSEKSEKYDLIFKKAEIAKKKVKDLDNKEIDKLFQIHHDYTKKMYPYASPRLSKSQAEAKLCINTSASFILLSILTFFKANYVVIRFLIYKEPFKEIIILTILAITFFVVAIFSYFAALKRNERFLSLLDSFFLITVDEKNDDYAWMNY